MPETLASRKVVFRERCTEVSEPAKVGTEEHEPNMRLCKLGKMPHHINAQMFRKKQQSLCRRFGRI